MKKNEKKWVLILVAITVILVIVLIVRNVNKKDKTIEQVGETNTNTQEFVQKLQDGTKLNTSTKLKETKKLDNLEIGNIQLTNQNGQSVLLADVKNNGTTKTSVILLDIILLDKEGIQIATIPGIISPLEAGATTQLNTSVQQDYSNAYDFSIVKK